MHNKHAARNGLKQRAHRLSVVEPLLIVEKSLKPPKA